MGLIYDARSIAKRDPAARSILEVMILYPGYHALIWHRLAHFFYRIHLLFIARMLSQMCRFFTGIEIHPAAKIGKGLFIDHGMGVVIGETAEIGDNCTIYHGATLGGTGHHVGKRHPTIGNNVLVSSGAKVLGPIIVGDNARVGAGAVVLHDVPPDATVVGVPGRVVTLGGMRVAPSVELDQTNLPDPASQDLCQILRRVAALEKKLAEEKKEV